MARQKYALNYNEQILYKESCVRHGFWGAYTNSLVITNQAVILEQYGLFNNFKGIERYPYSAISQAIQGEASNGESQLELYIHGCVEDFALQSGDDKVLRRIVTIINDCLHTGAAGHDYNYYKKMEEEDRYYELKAKAMSADQAAYRRQRHPGLLGGITEGLMEELGLNDIRDEFIEMGNEFREDFGLAPKMTNAERKELEELELSLRMQQGQDNADSLTARGAANNIYREVGAEPADTVAASTPTNQAVAEPADKKEDLKDQIEILKQLKELLDMGVLTQEEFENKKNEVLKS